MPGGRRPDPVTPVIVDPKPDRRTRTVLTTTMVYRLFDAEDRLLYVGVSSSGMTRWYAHDRVQSWWPMVARGSFEMFPDQDAAVEAEREAIIAEHPLYNVTIAKSAPPRASQRPRYRQFAVCHPTRPHYARDLCLSCYFREWRRLSKERAERRARNT